MENRWDLKQEVKEKYTTVVSTWLNTLRNMTEEDVEHTNELHPEKFELQLSDTELNPYTLKTLLIDEFGYIDNDNKESESNGWEMDFWMYLNNSSKEYPSKCENLTIYACGMTFELVLRVDC